MLDPWTTPSSYATRPVIAPEADQQGETYQDILSELLGEPVPWDPPTGMGSKLLLLGIAFAIGCMMGLA